MNNYNNKVGSCPEKSSYFSISNSNSSPFGLSVYASREEIKRVAKEVYNDIVSLIDNHQISLSDAFTDFCTVLNNKNIKVPSKKKLQDKIRFMLTKYVEKVTFCRQYRDQTPSLYVNDSYLKWCRQFNDTSLYEYSLHKNSIDKKQYGRASNYLTRSMGLASVAVKDGLTPFFLSITLDGHFHVSNDMWNDLTPEKTAKMLTAAYSDFLQFARNNDVDLESIRVIEPHRDGTPHIHAVIFIDALKKDIVIKALRKIFTQKHVVANNSGIYFEKCHDISKSIRYILKTFWNSSEYLRSWSSHVTRRFAITSNVRKVNNAGIFDAFRRESFKSKRDLYLQDKINSQISLIADTAKPVFSMDGEDYISFNHFHYIDKDDLSYELYNLIIETTQDGDYAQFLRLINNSFIPPTTNTIKSLESIVTLDKNEITELRTISKLEELRDSNLWHKVYDIEDSEFIFSIIRQKNDCKIRNKRQEFLEKHFKSPPAHCHI